MTLPGLSSSSSSWYLRSMPRTSFSLSIPRRWFLLSTTGAPEMLSNANFMTAFLTVSSGLSVTTCVVIRSLTFNLDIGWVFLYCAYMGLVHGLGTQPPQ